MYINKQQWPSSELGEHLKIAKWPLILLHMKIVFTCGNVLRKDSVQCVPQVRMRQYMIPIWLGSKGLLLLEYGPKLPSLCLVKRNCADAECLSCSFLSLAHDVSIPVSLWISTGKAAADGALKKRRIRVPRNGDGVTAKVHSLHTVPASMGQQVWESTWSRKSFSQPHLGGNWSGCSQTARATAGSIALHTARRPEGVAFLVPRKGKRTENWEIVVLY